MNAVNPRSWLALIAAGLMAGFGATTVVAQEADEEAAELDRVVVTGSRIARTAIEGPAPVTILSRDDIEQQGFTTVYEALNTLTQNVGNTQGEATTNVFTPNAQVVDLRGLGPGRTLILINGRRAADYPVPYNSEANFFNLASVPLAIVERIEVLSGGASAIYGSDAVAGVVNIILRDDIDGFELSARVGDTSQGGGESLRLQAAGGFLRDKLSVSYALEYLDRGRIDVSDRDYMDSVLDNPLASGNTEPSLVTVDFFPGTRVDPGADCDQFPELILDIRTTGLAGPQCGQYSDFSRRATIRNERENWSAYVNLSYELTPDTELYAYGNYWESESRNNPGFTFWFSAAEDGGGIFLNSDFSGLYLMQRSFQASELPGGDLFLDSINDEKSIDVAVGLRGQLFDTLFEYDFTMGVSTYDYERRRNLFKEEVVNDYFQGPLLGEFIGFPVYTANFERFNTPLTPEDVALLYGQSKTAGDTSVEQATFVVTGDIFEMPAGPVGFAAVAEYASQDYRITPDQRFQDTGNNGWWGSGATPVPLGERDRIALGVEFSLPLTETLRGTLAGRYDDYDDITGVDDAITYNLGLEWRPLDNLLFRATNATSFRAPDMQFIYGSSSFFIQGTDEYLCRRDEPGVPFPACTVPDINASGTSQSDPSLVEEEGDSTTIGFVWEPLTDLSISVDYFDIRLTGGVDNRGTGEILEIEADCRLGQTIGGQPVDINSARCQDAISRVTRRPADGSDFSEAILSLTTGPINRSVQEVDGYDATFQYRFDTRFGSFALASQYTHVLDSVDLQFAGDAPFTRDDLQNFEFRSRIRSTLSWSRDKWSATLFQERLGSTPNWEETGRIGPWIYYNGYGQYDITDNMRISLTVANLLDKDPPRDPTFDTWPYFSAFNYSPVGREVFLQFDWQL
jgi:outer membrane receptor protein involved in Fe transport